MESMTGFGKGIFQTEKYTITVYTKSLNHKYLDISLKLPKRYIFLEERIRNFVSQKIKRGKIEILIKYVGTELTPKEIFIDLSLAKKLKETLVNLGHELGFSDPLTFSDFLRFRDYLILEEKEENLDVLWEEVFPALDTAIKELIDARVKEGSFLKNILKSYLSAIEDEVSQIEKLKKKVIENNQEKLKNRIETLLKNFKVKDLDENRFYQELVYLLDKIDFSEELERLKTHIFNFKNTMEEEYCGKKLDFICQEMFREINTLSNKAQSSEISLIAVRVKDFIEKIREQVQNIA